MSRSDVRDRLPRRAPPPATILGALGLAALLCAAPPVAADSTRTGIVRGVVVDTSELGLPGAAVTISGVGPDRTVYSDAEGRFRFPALQPGSYLLQGSIPGLAGELAVQVFTDRTSDVELRLEARDEPTETGEPIQVLALAPLLDRFRARVGTTVSRAFLDELPVRRFYQSVALLLPDVAGGRDGNPNVGGALRSENQSLVDGVDTSDPTTGLFGLNLAFESIDEVEVTTAAAPAQLGGTSGAVINVVTRSGGESYAGLARWIVTNRAWDADYERRPDRGHIFPELAAAETAPDDLDATISATLGGPLWPRRLRFFAAYEDGDRTFLRPTRQGVPWDEDTELESASLKLTAALAPGHDLVLQHTSDEARFAAFTPFDRAPAENRVSQSPNPLGESFVDRLPGDVFAVQDELRDGELSKLEWTGAFGQSTSVQARVARQERRLRTAARGSRGLTADAPHVAVTELALRGPDEVELRRILVANGITGEGTEEREREQGNLALSRFFTLGAGDHELRGGVDYEQTSSRRQVNFPGAARVDPVTGFPVEGQMYLDVDLRPRCLFDGICEPFDVGTGVFQPFARLDFWRREPRATEIETLAAYLSDDLVVGRWLFSAGVRWESTRGDDDRGRRLVEDTVWSPRLAVKLDPLGRGEALLSLAWSRYHEPFRHAFLDSFLRPEVFSGYTEWDWRHEVAECAAADPADLASPCWRPLAAVPFAPAQPAGPARDLERAHVDEIVAGFERQLTPDAALRLHWIDRRWNDLWDDVLVFAADGRLLSSVRNLEIAERRHQALQLLVQKRLERRWQLLAAYTWSRSEGNLFDDSGDATFADFVDVTDANVVNRFGPAPYDREHQIEVFANLQIPAARSVLSLGSALVYETGTPYQAEARGDFGTLFLTPRGELRLGDLFQWDLSLAADLPLAETLGLEAKVEVFNVTDAQTQIGVESDVESPTFGLARSIADLQEPRSFRVTLGLRF